MTKPTHVVTVKIYDQSYHLKCHVDDAEQLRQAAKRLDQMMRTVSEQQHILSIDKVAVITALTITQEYLKLHQDSSTEIQSVNTRLKKLLQKIQNTLTHQEEFAL